MKIFTSIVSTSDGAKTFLAGSVPNLEFAQFVVNLGHFESKVDSDGGQVVVNEVVITEADEEGRFPDSLVAYDDYLKQKILLFDHSIDYYLEYILSLRVSLILI